jgi:hypothetical protein
MKKFIALSALAALMTTASFVQAQTAGAAADAKGVVKVALNDETRCKKEIRDYTEALKFVRESAGDQVSAKVMSNYVPLEQLNQVVANSGSCAGAQLLRDKRVKN